MPWGCPKVTNHCISGLKYTVQVSAVTSFLRLSQRCPMKPLMKHFTLKDGSLFRKPFYVHESILASREPREAAVPFSPFEETETQKESATVPYASLVGDCRTHCRLPGLAASGLDHGEKLGPP